MAARLYTFGCSSAAINAFVCHVLTESEGVRAQIQHVKAISGFHTRKGGERGGGWDVTH